MTVRLVVLMLAFAGLQDPEIQRLAEQLGHDDPAKRQQAEERLLQTGEPARAALERLQTGNDVEVATRARSLLASLDRSAARRIWLGPGWTVSLEEREYRLGDLPGLLKGQLPVPLQFPASAAESRVRIGAREAPAWQFLDRLCDAHGGLRIPLDRPSGAFALEEGKPSRAPTCYSGPFRIWIDKLTLEEHEGWRCGRLVLAIGWQPNAHPLLRDYLGREFNFKISEITDEKGTPLQGKPDRAAGMGGFTLDRTRETVWRNSVEFIHPPAGVRKLGRLKGTVRMVFPAEVKLVEFKTPVSSASSPVKAGDYTITLFFCRRVETGIVAKLGIARTGRDAIEIRARYRDQSIQMRGADGTFVPFDVRRGAHSSSDGSESAELEGFFALKGQEECLSFSFVAGTFEHEVPFEFTNVELP